MPPSDDELAVQLAVETKDAISDLRKFVNKATEGLEKIGDEADDTGKSLNKMTKSIDAKKAIAGLAGLAVGVAGVTTAFAGLKDVLDDGKSLQNMATNTGVALKDLEDFRVMTVLMGGTIDDTADSIQDFTEKMGEASADAQSSWADAFKKIGVTLSDNVTPAIHDTLKALAMMVDEGKKSEAFFVGVDLFGDAFKRTFADMIANGLEPFEKKMEEVADLRVFNEKFTAELKQLDIIAQRGVLKIQKAFSGFLSGGGLEVIGGALDWVSNLFGETGKEIGDVSEKAGAKFKDLVVDTIIPALRDVNTVAIEIFGSISKGFAGLKGAFKPVELVEGGDEIVPILELLAKKAERIFLVATTNIKEMFADMLISIGEASPLVFKGLAEAGEELKKSLNGLDGALKLENLDAEIANITKAIATTADFDSVNKVTTSGIKSMNSALDSLSASISSYSSTAQEASTLKSPIGDLGDYLKELASINPDEFLSKGDQIRKRLSGIKFSEELDLGELFDLDSMANEFDAMYNTIDQSQNEHFTGALQATQAFASSSMEMYNNIANARIMADQRANASWKAGEVERINGLSLSANARKKALDKIQKEDEKRAEETKEQYKKNQIANAWIGALSGIPAMTSGFLGAFAKFGLAGIPLATTAISTATGLAIGSATTQTAMINSYQDGGVFGGVQNARFGSDDTIATVKVGEMAMNATMQRELLDIARGNTEAGRGGDTFILERGTEDQLQELEDMITELRSRGRA